MTIYKSMQHTDEIPEWMRRPHPRGCPQCGSYPVCHKHDFLCPTLDEQKKSIAELLATADGDKAHGPAVRL